MNWIVFILIIQVLHFSATWKLYQKAGRKSWEALIPVYNAVVLMKIINRPKWWVILLFIPVINLLIFPVIWVEIARSFRKFDTKDTWLAILSLGFYNFYLNYVIIEELKYNANRSTLPASKTGEWISSITFAIAAATFVHTYIMQPFTIPTSSLEKSLLIGDFLFVSKFHYGAKVPVSPVSLPMVHDSIPGTGIRSYVKGIELPYMRLPGFQDIKRNEIVVFNWPSDSLALMWGDNSNKFTYKPIDKKTNYVKRCVGVAGDSLEIKNGYIFINGERTTLPDRAKPQFYYTVKTRELLDAKKIYSTYGVNPNEWNVECVNDLYLNLNQVKTLAGLEKNKHNYIPEGSSTPIYNPYYILGLENIEENKKEDLYCIRLKTSKHNRFGIPTKEALHQLKRDLNLTDENIKNVETTYRINLDKEHALLMKQTPEVISIKRNIEPKGSFDPSIFPHSPMYSWSQDNFGPIYIPAKGDVLKLNKKTIPFYERIISEYEKNDFNIEKDGTIYINGIKTNKYTVKQDYFWMMGDNRQGSLDARYWGYTPFDHVVGKPVFIWMSLDQNETAINKKIRWERLFTTVGGEGAPKSYFIYFLISLGLYYVGKEVIKRRK
ncbi:MAG: signal peptidase I [Wenyingzhuangia sp.]|jgi:signal peptidase I|uniref:signal peptidase I n=1 Tax=Wenyingzhuangia sp. TaxID=1964193 RepID=UPI00321C1781